jgi:hypothetical protein
MRHTKTLWEKGDRQGKSTNLLQEKIYMCELRSTRIVYDQNKSNPNDTAEVQNLNRINLSVNNS